MDFSAKLRKTLSDDFSKFPLQVLIFVDKILHVGD
jgi:hypothetical protein